MNEVKLILNQIYFLVKQTKKDEASQILIERFGEKIISFLRFRLGWNEEDAISIFHDCIIAIFIKIENNELEYLSLKWIMEYCKNAGSNKYRKIMSEKKKLETYMKTIQQEFYDDIKNYTGINDSVDFEPEEKSRYQKALRAFSLLDEKCQEITKLKFVNEISHKEIANKLSRINNERSSIAILNRCINRWKKLIDEMDD